MNKNIAETKIKGLKIYMNENYVTIMDSYKILNKNKMSIILDKIKQKENYFFLLIKEQKNLWLMSGLPAIVYIKCTY